MTNKNTRTFTPSDDALIFEQPFTGIDLKTLAKKIRTSQEMLIRRANELGVSLAISDDYDGARALRCSDKLVDPLLERLKQIHGDQKQTSRNKTRAKRKSQFSGGNDGPDLRGRGGRGESRGRAPMG